MDFLSQRRNVGPWQFSTGAEGTTRRGTQSKALRKRGAFAMWMRLELGETI